MLQLVIVNVWMDFMKIRLIIPVYHAIILVYLAKMMHLIVHNVIQQISENFLDLLAYV